MRNVWKGLIVGAFTGAATGLVLDLLDGGARQVSSGLESASHGVPLVTDRVREGVSEISDRLQESELPQRVKDAATKAGQRAAAAASSESAAAARQHASEVAAEAKQAASQHASELADVAKEAASHGRRQAARSTKDAADRSRRQAGRIAAAGKEKIGSATGGVTRTSGDAADEGHASCTWAQ
jgi:hypothetical protein